MCKYLFIISRLLHYCLFYYCFAWFEFLPAQFVVTATPVLNKMILQY